MLCFFHWDSLNLKYVFVGLLTVQSIPWKKNKKSDSNRTLKHRREFYFLLLRSYSGVQLVTRLANWEPYPVNCAFPIDRMYFDRRYIYRRLHALRIDYWNIFRLDLSESNWKDPSVSSAVSIEAFIHQVTWRIWQRKGLKVKRSRLPDNLPGLNMLSAKRSRQ